MWMTPQVSYENSLENEDNISSNLIQTWSRQASGSHIFNTHFSKRHF